MNTNRPRVRFAPSPTGLMHLGNIRIALLNYLFAKQKNGTFVLRIEDTDKERNVDPKGCGIINDLTWLGLLYDEGPESNGAYGPYFQSQRSHIYQEKLETLKELDAVYRCFCTAEELELKRKRQLALKRPPRYDQACLSLSKENVQQKTEQKTPFIWRLKTTANRQITFEDLARGTMHFNLKDFSDLPLTRADGSFTFTFANCVDDMEMEISHVIRGEDHISNTTGQVILYEMLKKTVPLFWHVPIMCNIEGKKLSKRDFGFSLTDLQKGGFVPEAILNYLGIIGGSFEHEIMSLKTLARVFPFDSLHSTGYIKYDVEKLRWINHKWLHGYDTQKLANACLPFLIKAYPDAGTLSEDKLRHLISIIKTDLETLADSVDVLKFYFERPSIQKKELRAFVSDENLPLVISILQSNMSRLSDTNTYLAELKKEAADNNIPLKELFASIRFLLTGSFQGLGIKELLSVFETSTLESRIGDAINAPM